MDFTLKGIQDAINGVNFKRPRKNIERDCLIYFKHMYKDMMSLTALAEEFNLSIERVRQIVFEISIELERILKDEK